MIRIMKNNFYGNHQGTALVYGLVIMLSVSIILTSIITFIVAHTKSSLWTHAKEQSFQVAESGIYFYRWYLAHSVEGKTAQQIEDFWETGNPYGVDTPYEAEYLDPSGSAIGRYSLEVAPPDSGSTIVTVTATGWTYKYPDIKRTVKVRFRRPSWSEYVLLGNAMQRLGSGTDVSGKVFANNGVHFDGVAHNVVSSAVETYYDNDTGIKAWKPGVWTAWDDEYNDDMGSNVFLAGKSFPDPTIDFSAVTADLGYIKSVAQDGSVTDGCNASGCYFGSQASLNGFRIILHTNDTFDICPVNSFHNNGDIIKYKHFSGGGTCNSCSGQCLRNYSIPDNGVIFVENNAWVEGTIDGKRLTIASANLKSSNKYNIYVKNDIRYTHTDGTDVLGLLSQNDIEIIENSENDLRIDGALLAQNGRVGRENYGNVKDTITVYGAIATNQRYGFAYTNGTGYTNRNLYYDNNLLYNPPPYFPTGTQYLIDLWEEL
jgi:hypothetical protein